MAGRSFTPRYGVKNTATIQDTSSAKATIQKMLPAYSPADERAKPKRPGQVWSGPHVHIEWAGEGPPAALPGMTSEQVTQAMNPGGDPNASANAMGINTPATAPPAPAPRTPDRSIAAPGSWATGSDRRL